MPSDWKKKTSTLNKEQEKFITLIEKLPEELYDKKGITGNWTPMNLIAHMSGWDEEVVRQFNLFLSGNNENIEHDIDEFNKNSVEKRKNLNWQELVNELKSIQTDLFRSILSINSEHRSSNNQYEEWIDVLIDHYQHHNKQIEKWL